jgi:hypothetical protein
MKIDYEAAIALNISDNHIGSRDYFIYTKLAAIDLNAVKHRQEPNPGNLGQNGVSAVLDPTIHT